MRLPSACLAVAMVVASMSGAVGVSPAAAIPPECQEQKQRIKTGEGQTVWIPSNRQAGPFQFGGHQSRTRSDGRMTARTNGSADTVGGSGGVNLGVWQASAKYDRQWNRSTTETGVKTSSFTTTSPTMPRKVHWRWKIYFQGRLFRATMRVWNPKACDNHYSRKATFRVVVPVRRGHHSYDVERWGSRGQVHNSRGKPMGF